MNRSLVVVLAILLVPALAGCTGGDEPKEPERWQVRVVLLDGSIETREATTMAPRSDRDRDDLEDLQEMLLGTDPADPDTDRDGLLDGRNVRLRADDALVDAWRERGILSREVDDGLLFLGEWGETDDPIGGEPLRQDTDEDGMIDGEELLGYPVSVRGVERHVRTLVYASDSDGDGVADGVERAYGIDPTIVDTDEDGVSDLTDLDPTLDLRMTLRVSSLHLDGTGSVDVVLYLNLPGDPYQSAPVRVTRGTEWTGDAFDADRDPDDDGANLPLRDWNLTFSVTLLDLRTGEGSRIDVFGTTTGTPYVTGRIDARTGLATFRSGGAVHEWPEAFEGPDGSVRLGLSLQQAPWGTIGAPAAS